MSGPRIEVQLAPLGWTHIGGPQLHALVARTEDDELLVAASDAADTGSVAAVVAVLTGGGELAGTGALDALDALGSLGSLGSPVAVTDGGAEPTTSFVVLGWGETTRVVVRGEGYAVAQVGDELVRLASASEAMALTLGPEAEQVNLCAPDERAAQRFAAAVDFDAGRYAELVAAAASRRGSAAGSTAGGSETGPATGVAATGVAARVAARVAPPPSVPSVIAAPPVWGRAPVVDVEPAPVPVVRPAAAPRPRGGFDLARLRGWDRLSAPAPGPAQAPAPVAAAPEHTLQDRPAPEPVSQPVPEPVAQSVPRQVPEPDPPVVPPVAPEAADDPAAGATSYDFLLQPARRSPADPAPAPSAVPAPRAAAEPAEPAAPADSADRADSVQASPAAPATPTTQTPAAPAAALRPEPAAAPQRPGGPRISSVPWRRREPEVPAPGAPPVVGPAPSPVVAPVPTAPTTGVRTPPQHAALWGAGAPQPATAQPASAPPASVQPATVQPATAQARPEPVPLVDRFLGSPTRPQTPQPPAPHTPPTAAATATTNPTTNPTSYPATNAPTEPDPDATIERSQLAGALGGPSVLAVLCPQGHVGPPQLATCRRCGLEIPPQEPYHTARPALGVLKLSTGDLVTLDRGVLLGRNPRPSDTTPPLLRPHVLKVPSPERDISRNHAEILLEGWHVLIRDLDSTNGTTITLPGGPPTRLRPNDQQVVEPGTIITLADEVDIVYEVEP